MIRKAKYGDIRRLTVLMHECHQRSKYSDLTANEKLLKQVCMEAIRSNAGNETLATSCLYVSETEGVVDGLIIGALMPASPFVKELATTDEVFYVTPGTPAKNALGLFKAYLDWFDNHQKVQFIQLAATNAVQPYEGMEALFKRHSLEQEGVIYSKWKEPKS